MAASFVHPSARDAQTRSAGTYSAGWRGAGSRDEEGAGESDRNGGFVANEELGEPSTRPVRAPADADAIEWNDAGGACFACAFTKRKQETIDTFNEDEVQDAYADMIRLIADNYTRMSNPELVKLIHAFYEREIRPLGFDEWTHTSIARHIMFHTNDEDTIMQEMTTILYSQIQSLRSQTWVECSAEAKIDPSHKNILLLDRLCKSLGDHLAKKKLRKAT
jgi:hypothetical protein